MPTTPSSIKNAGQPKTGRARTSTLRRLWPYLRKRPWNLAAAFAALLGAASLTLTFPVAFRRVIDNGFEVGNTELINKYFIALIAVALLLALATALRFYLCSRMGERLVADLRGALFDHLVGLEPGFFENLRTSEVTSRLTSDMAVVQSAVGSTASIALRNLLLLLGAAGMMLITSPRLTLLVLFLVPPVVIPLVLLGRALRRMARRLQDRIAEATGIMGESLQEIALVQAFTAEVDIRERGRVAVERAYVAARRQIAVRARLTALLIFLVVTGVVGIAWVGAADVTTGRLSAGELGQFVFYAVFLGGSCAALSEVWGTLQQAAGASDRLFELLDTQRTITVPKNPKKATRPFRGEIVFLDVSFRYPARPELPALDKFSLQIRPGERLAIVGPSGAGKSTLFQLLLRFYDPTSGCIEIDGVDIRDMDPQALRQMFSVVPQKPAIFARSAAANIALGKLDASRAEIEKAARTADAHHFLSQLPEGYDTWLGERGVMLSGGQSQRVAIARAVLRDAPMLLLDEATSSLDAASEQAVQKAVERLSEGRTSLTIAHRLATVQQAHRIAVMEAGRVVAEGTHDSLASAGGLYARLARLQFMAREDGIDKPDKPRRRTFEVPGGAAELRN